MEYPGARFTRPIRLSVLIIFVGAFLIISPIVLLYAAGFHYDWHNGFLRETGGLSIDILPTTATVIIDGLPLNETLPIRLKNITPKNYHIELRAAGYYTWEKDSTVSPRQTTYLKDITLIKKNEPQLIVAGAIDSLSISNNGRYSIFSKKNTTTTDFFLYDQKTNITASITKITTTSTLKTTWNDNDSFVITNSNEPYTTFIVGEATNLQKITNLAITTGTITKYIWKTGNEAVLYLSTSSSIFSYSPLVHQKQTITTNDYQDWHLVDNILWTINHTTTTVAVTRDTLGFKEYFTNITVTTTNIALEQFNPVSWKIATVHNDYILLQQRNAPHMVLAEKTKQYNLNTNKFLISQYNNWWLLSNDSEIWSYIENTNETPSLLLRSGELLKNYTPLDTFNTLGIQYTNSVNVLFPYEYVEEKIINEDVRYLTADSIKRTIFYSTPQGLYSLAY